MNLLVGDFSLFFSLVLSLSLSKAGLPLRRAAVTSLSSSAPSLIDSLKKSKASSKKLQKNLLVSNNITKIDHPDAANDGSSPLSAVMRQKAMELVSRQRCESMHGKRKSDKYASFEKDSDAELDEEESYIPTAEKIDNLILNSGGMDEDDGVGNIHNFADIKKMWEQKSISSDTDNNSKASLIIHELSAPKNLAEEDIVNDNVDNNIPILAASDVVINEIANDSPIPFDSDIVKDSSITLESNTNHEVILSKQEPVKSLEQEDIAITDNTSKLSDISTNSSLVNMEFTKDQIDGNETTLKVKVSRVRTRSRETNIDDAVHVITRSCKETNIDDVIEAKVIQRKETNIDDILLSNESDILQVADLTSEGERSSSPTSSSFQIFDNDSVLSVKRNKSFDSQSVANLHQQKTDHTVGLVKQISESADNSSKSYNSKLFPGLKRQSSLYKSESLPTLILSVNDANVLRKLSPGVTPHNATAPLALPEDFDHTPVANKLTPNAATVTKKESVRRKKFSFYSKHAFRNREIFSTKKTQSEKPTEPKSHLDSDRVRPKRLLSPDREPETVKPSGGLSPTSTLRRVFSGNSPRSSNILSVVSYLIVLVSDNSIRKGRIFNLT